MTPQAIQKVRELITRAMPIHETEANRLEFMTEALALLAVEQTGWMDIKDCPRNDLTTKFLGVNMRGKQAGEVFTFRNTFVPDEEFPHANPEACWIQPFSDWPCYPTHFMHHPPPPKTAPDAEGER